MNCANCGSDGWKDTTVGDGKVYCENCGVEWGTYPNEGPPEPPPTTLKPRKVKEGFCFGRRD